MKPGTHRALHLMPLFAKDKVPLYRLQEVQTEPNCIDGVETIPEIIDNVWVDVGDTHIQLLELVNYWNRGFKE